ncbi:MAG: thiamine-phosphate synthase family protein [Candidatus Methanofastidiosia archaeon]
MYPPCLVFLENVFQNLRIRVAHNLQSVGFTQSDIANHLHVSQAMVSKYLSRQPEESQKLDEVAVEVATMIAQNKPEQDIILYICQTCFKWREGGITCQLHNVKNCTVCTRLRSPQVFGQKKKIIQNIQEALHILESTPGITAIVPEVRMNIAMALPEAATPMDVVAIPGRLVPIHQTVHAVSDPEFGASHHLASILIRTKNTAVINIRYDQDIHAVIQKLKFSFTFSQETPADIFIDRGGFGIEPAAYIFGDNAVKAAIKVKKIAVNLL